jgi:hypothetical protein
MYFMILLTAPKCSCVGFSINRLTYPTEYAMSGLVFIRYLKLPTKLLYNVQSTGGAELILLNFSLGSIGVAHGLHPSSLAFSTILSAYAD